VNSPYSDQISAPSNLERQGYPALSWVQYAYPFDYDLLAEKIVEKLRGSDPRVDRLKKQISDLVDSF
jgi:hypothetical protein